MFKLRFKHYLQISLFILVSLVLILLFSILIGDYNPLAGNRVRYQVSFNYASGLRRGAPVRLAGVNIGKVKQVSLQPNHATHVLVEVEVKKSSAPSIKTDTEAFINVAGLMGETYLELTTGTPETEPLPVGKTIAGQDPPRLDQLMYEALTALQSANQLIGDVQPEISTFITELKTLLSGFNKTMSQLSRQEKKAFAKHLMKLVSNMATLTSQLTSAESAKIVEHVQSLLNKADLVNEQNIRAFFQKEGIKAKIF